MAKAKLTYRDLGQDRRDALILEHGVTGYANLIAEFKATERERQRLLSIRRRANRREQLDGYPGYSERLLALIDRWLVAHEGGSAVDYWNVSDIVEQIQRHGFKEGLHDYNAVSSRGMGQILRKNNYKVIRASNGMRVFGLKGGM